MAPPRHRRKRRPSRTVSSPPPPVEPEPEPPPRRGIMAALLGAPQMGPSGTGPVGPMPPVRRSAPPVTVGPPWTRRDWYVLSAVAAAVVVLIGLLLGLSATASSTVQAKPAPTTTSFAVASGAGKDFVCGTEVSLNVGGTPTHIASIDADQITLTSPLDSAPSSGATVSQNITTPARVDVCGAVAASPAPTRTQLTLAGGAGQFFGNIAINVGGVSDTVTSVNSTTYRLTLQTALPAAPVPGTEVTELGYTTGSLIGGIVELATSATAILVIAVAAWVARPIASRLRRKARPRLLETFVFGACVAVVDTLVYSVDLSSFGNTTGGFAAFAALGGVASGFILVPPAYPAISRLFRRRPRQVPSGPSGR
ncbi:MAG: hypothetical protein ACLQGJ_07120 [Candidatus Dormibacteria bacterium]